MLGFFVCMPLYKRYIWLLVFTLFKNQVEFNFINVLVNILLSLPRNYMNNRIRKTFFFLLLFFLTSKPFFAQSPKNKAILHYNTVYFEDSLIKTANSYKLSLALDSLFLQPVLFLDSNTKKLPAFHVNNLKWGTSYYWRINAYNNGKIEKQGEIHKFSIMNIRTSYMDTLRLKVIKNLKEKNNGGFIAFDNCRTIFDREGNPVWTLPLIKDVSEFNIGIRDLKLTKDNTFTFLGPKTPFEIDFEGNILWKGVKPLVIGKDTIKYHHDFKKDKYGNYWVLGNKIVYRKILKKLDDNILKDEDKILITDTGVYRGTEVGLLMKFNKNNQLLWMWDANSYLKDEDLNYKLTGNGFPTLSSHMNAFSFNEKLDEVCIGFRDISRIVKINVKTGKVISSYGEMYPSGDAKLANNAFSSQHDCFINKENNIFILNNNTLNKEPSSVIELYGNHLKNRSVLWRFNLKFDELTNGKSEKGGNVTELKNGNLLVCAGALNRTFEVTRKNEIVWDAFIQHKINKDTSWANFPQYRCSFVAKLPIYRFIPITKKSETKNNKVKKIQIIVHNTGNSDDSYVLKVLDKNDKVILQKLTKQIKVNENYTKELKLPKELKNDSICKISIRSNSTLNNIKTLKINLTNQ